MPGVVSAKAEPLLVGDEYKKNCLVEGDNAKGATGVYAGKLGKGRKKLVGCLSVPLSTKLVAGVRGQLLEKHNCCWPYAGIKNPVNMTNTNSDFTKHLAICFYTSLLLFR
jgi:hypothetical protein